MRHLLYNDITVLWKPQDQPEPTITVIGMLRYTLKKVNDL